MSNIKTIDVSVSGLNPKESYQFNFVNKGGNWPVKVSPLSGIFYPGNLKTYVYFCPNTGLCPKNDTSVFYNMPSGDVSSLSISIGKHSLYSILELSITNSSNNKVVYTHPCIVECDECLPELMISTDQVLLDNNTGSAVPFSAQVDGLISNQQYNYKFTGINANWPMKIIPLSGVIQTANNSFKINALASFCSSVTGCSSVSNLFNYENIESCKNYEEFYSVVELSVTPVNNVYQSATKNSFSIVCNDCIPQLKASLPSTVDFNSGTSAKQTINATINNMIVGETYNFNFEGLGANWPVILYPSSGTITATTSNTIIPVRVTFCQSSGICPPNSTNVQPYSISQFAPYGDSQLDRVCRIRLSLDRACSASKVYSNELIAVCNNCLPPYTVKFSDGPIVTLNLGCCSGVKLFDVNVNGAVPYQDYEFSFAPVTNDGTLTLIPNSGNVRFDNADTTVSTFAKIVLNTDDIKLLDFTLRNKISGETATDRLVVKCGTYCG